jgi:AP-2 complex subunit alpha
MQNDIVKLLGVFITVREPNLKYLALETMCKFTSNCDFIIDNHLQTILKCLRGNDISIKRRALDLLYLMCTPAKATTVVEELLSYS